MKTQKSLVEKKNPTTASAKLAQVSSTQAPSTSIGQVATINGKPIVTKTVKTLGTLNTPAPKTTATGPKKLLINTNLSAAAQAKIVKAQKEKDALAEAKAKKLAEKVAAKAAKKAEKAAKKAEKVAKVKVVKTKPATGEFHKGKDGVLTFDHPVSTPAFEAVVKYHTERGFAKTTTLTLTDLTVTLTGNVTTQIKNWTGQFLYGYLTATTPK